MADLLIVRSLLGDRTKDLSQSQRASANFIALASAAWFAAHPLATESVTYIAQRFTSLAAMFYLLAAWLHFSAFDTEDLKRRRWPRSLSVIVLVLGMLTKECTVTAPVMIVFIDAMLRGVSWQVALRRGLPLLLCLPLVPGMVMLATWLSITARCPWRA